MSKANVLIPLNGVGCGQGGSNIALAAEKLGLFSRLVLANTTTADEMAVDEARRILCLDPDNPRRGAGKDAFRGRDLFKENYDNVKELLTLNFSETPPDSFYLVTASLGGGSGNGMANLMAATLKRMSEDAPVLGLFTWPEKNLLEPRVASNVIMGMEESAKGSLDSLMLIDNDKVYGAVRSNGISIEKVNEQIWKPWRYLVQYVGQRSSATMDVEDFDRLVRMRRCAAVYETMTHNVDTADILRAKMLESWENDHHMYLEEYSQPHRIPDDGGQRGFGILLACSPATFSKKRSLFESLYSSLEMLLPTSTQSYRGFVADSSLKDNEIRIITLFTGLPYPTDRVKDLAVMIKEAKAKRSIQESTSFLDGLSVADLRDDGPSKPKSAGLTDLWGELDEKPEAAKDTMDELDSLIGSSTPRKRRGFGRN